MARRSVADKKLRETLSTWIDDAGLDFDSAWPKAWDAFQEAEQQQKARRREKLAEYQRRYRERARLDKEAHESWAETKLHDLTITVTDSQLATITRETDKMMKAYGRTLKHARQVIFCDLIATLRESQQRNDKALSRTVDSFQLLVNSQLEKGATLESLRECYEKTIKHFPDFPALETFAGASTLSATTTPD